MKMFEVRYSTNMENRETTIISADTYTMAYLEFSVKYPSFYIVEMTEITEVI